MSEPLAYHSISLEEAEILAHRLEVSDAVHETLTDDSGVDDPRIIDACERLLKCVHDRRLPLALTEIERLVLTDVLDGNTALVDLKMAADTGQISQSKASRLRRAGRDLPDRLAGMYGGDFPEVPV